MTSDGQAFVNKVAAFLGTHRRVVEDFERSLSSARHFLQLADRSMEIEPENTVAMLEQIKEIDLLAHLSRQFEEYEHVAGFLLPPNSPMDDARVVTDLQALTSRYEALVSEAEAQMETIDRLLFGLQNQQ